MNCGECGHALDPGDDFCSECGTAINADGAERTGSLSYDELLAQRAALWSSVDAIQARRLEVSSAESKHGSVATVDPPLELGGGTPLAELEATVTTIGHREAEMNDAQSAIGRHRQAIAGLEAKSKNVRMVVIGALIAVPVLILVLLLILISAVA